MLVNGRHYFTVWLKEGNDTTLCIIDQRKLPHQFLVEELKTVNEVAEAIKEMHVRGAGLIGATAAYGMYMAVREASIQDNFEQHILQSAALLKSTRPTAVNLEWAVDRQLEAIQSVGDIETKLTTSKNKAIQIAEEDAECCRQIGLNGWPLIESIFSSRNNNPVNILTHCNAGWLAFVDFGSALAPVYEAHARGINLHVFVDETRPRNQGAGLTAWELKEQGVPYTVIADNAGGHLMQHGKIDLVITGADRVTRTGDAANKIGTYLKALAAYDNKIPFYVALPSSTFDWNLENGLESIPIEERNPDEINYVEGFSDGAVRKVRITPPGSPAANYGFDVTPARLITGLITERGICQAREEDIRRMFPKM